MTTITGTIKVWLTDDELGPDDLKTHGEKVLGQLGYSNSDNMANYGWTCIGSAEITVTLIDESQMVANKVDSLRKEISKTRSDAEMKVRSLEDKVQKLLAITNEVKDEA